jgi:hypothetical protein
VPVIFYGVRNYGRVDAHAGEHAQTQFFHVYWLPLFPTGSSWVTGPRPDGTNAHGIKLHGKSVASAYLRIWGPLIAIANLSVGFSEGKPVHLIVAAVAAVLAAWSWTTQKLRGAAAARRSDFNYVAFGTRCEPKRMFASHRAVCKKQLDQRWTELAPKHSPNEVAQRGADRAAEAVLAYGLLRLSSLDRGGAADGADADRILDGRFDAPSTMDGPYRAGPASTSDAATAAALAELVAQKEQQARVVPIAADPAVAPRKKRSRARLQLAGLIFLTLAAAGGALAFVAALRPAVDVTARELRGIKPPIGRIVNVTCDAVEDPIWEETNDRGKTTSRITMCHLGQYLLPLQLDADGALPPNQVTGKLREVSERALWVRDGLRKEPALDARALEVYIDTTTTSELGPGLFGLAIVLATPVLWILWFRARRKRLATSS